MPVVPPQAAQLPPLLPVDPRTAFGTDPANIIARTSEDKHVILIGNAPRFEAGRDVTDYIRNDYLPNSFAASSMRRTDMRLAPRVHDIMGGGRAAVRYDGRPV